MRGGSERGKRNKERNKSEVEGQDYKVRPWEDKETTIKEIKKADCTDFRSDGCVKVRSTGWFRSWK